MRDNYGIEHSDDFDETRPRSRLILQELAERSQQGEHDAYVNLKTRVSKNAVRGLGVLLVAVLLTAVFFQFLQNNSQQVEAERTEPVVAEAQFSGRTAQPTVSASPTRIFVHVVGAVAKPGVYEFAVGDRVADALDRAGGALESADVSKINLAAQLVDAQQIYVPAEGEEIPVAGAGVSQLKGSGQGITGASNGLININTASQAELEQLPKVGPATAQKIIAYREAHGPLSSLEDLLGVSGIGEKTLENFEGLVTF